MTYDFFMQEPKKEVAEALNTDNYKVEEISISDIDCNNLGHKVIGIFNHPILVITKELQKELTGLIVPNKYKILFGKMNLAWAKDNNYTHITAYVLKDAKYYNKDRRRLKKLYR